MADLKRARICVLMGGFSSEREVSLVTGRCVHEELVRRGHRSIAYDLCRRDLKCLLALKPDVVFNALHGTFGEDGVVQGALEFYGIPYTGPGVEAAAISMNKPMTKQLVSAAGVKVARGAVCAAAKEAKELGLSLPLVVKPACEGSAVGVYIARDAGGLKKFFAKAASLKGPVLVEEYVEGVEISVPVMGGRALPVIEIVPKNEFYDYDAKYTAGKSNHIIPARISKKAEARAKEAALTAHKALGCSGISRSDFIVRKGEPVFLEINTLPGMTPVSLFPESAAAAGVNFYGVIMYLLKEAMERKKR